MEKNWLIRTKSNHILGPISKEKVLELYRNGSIKADDEICSGNGYWFFIRETDLVERFLTGSEIQDFNPISEAKDVLTSSESGSRIKEPAREHITQVGGINLQMFKSELEAVPASNEETGKKKPITKPRAKTSGSMMNTLKKQSYLKYLGIMLALLFIMMIFFRKIIMRTILGSEGAFIAPLSLISSAHAQNEQSSKKKSF